MNLRWREEWFGRQQSDEVEQLRRNNAALLEENSYLQQELDVCRSFLGDRLRLTPDQKARLVRFAEPLGNRIYHLVKIVHPSTFRRWPKQIREGALGKATGKKMARPRTKKQIVDLILRFAEENVSWSHHTIHAELVKLGIEISKSTVYRYMEENGLEPSRFRKLLAWKEFLKRQAATAWAADFFCVRTLTGRGFVTFYVLLFIHHYSRRMWVAGATRHLNKEWVNDQGKRFIDLMKEQNETVTHLIVDQDRKFPNNFKETMKAAEIKLQFISKGAPKMNAYAEVAIRTTKHQCLNLFVPMGYKHLMYLLKEFEKYYNHFRPHRGLGNVPIDPVFRGPKEKSKDVSRRLKSFSYLGGLHHHYEWVEPVAA